MKQFDLKNYKGGWIPDLPDGRDFKWDKFFGAITPSAGELPEEFSWWDKCPSKIPNQLNIPSCVSCSFAFLQAFNSKQERNFNELLSWAFIWANLGDKRLPYGSTYRDNAKICKNIGISEERLYPTEQGIKDKFDASKIKKQAFENAKIFRIKSYSYVNWLDFKRALYRQPVIVAVGGNNQNWADFSKPIKFCGYDKIQWFHSIVIIGWTKDGCWEFVNWWGEKRNHGFLAPHYPFEAMLSVEDIPDLPKKVKMFRIIKTKTNPTCYLTNEKLLTRQAIFSSKDFEVLTGQIGKQEIDWSCIETVSEEEMNKYRLVGKIIAINR